MSCEEIEENISGITGSVIRNDFMKRTTITLLKNMNITSLRMHHLCIGICYSLKYQKFKIKMGEFIKKLFTKQV